jgi:histone H3/H4
VCSSHRQHIVQAASRCYWVCAPTHDSVTVGPVQNLLVRILPHDNNPRFSKDIPEKITNESLQECTDSLARVAQELASHEKQLFDRLMHKLDTTSASQETAADITRLREEWESTQKSMDILSKAGNHLERNISIMRITQRVMQYKLWFLLMEKLSIV